MLYMEKKVGGLYLFVCKNYISLTCLNGFLAIFNLKNQGKKSAKTRKLGFLRKDCALGGGESRKPTKNQGEIQGSRKPSVLVGFLRQKKGLCIHPLDQRYLLVGITMHIDEFRKHF